MKLIEKLAEEWFLQNRDLNLRGDGVFSQSEAFIAGFRKAREMAYELMKENADKRIFQLDVDIENLGEEEV